MENTSVLSIPDLRPKKNDFRPVWWVMILLVIAFESLGRSIFMMSLYFYEPVVFFFLLIFIVIYSMNKAVKKLKWNTLEIYALVLILFLPLQSAVVANYYWGQPLIYGFLSQRAWALSAIAIVFFYQFNTRKITLYQVKDSLLAVAWIQLFIYFIIEMLFVPNRRDVVYQSCNDVKGACTYAFDNLFLCFAFLYYFMSFVKKNSWKYAAYAGVFLIYIFFFYNKRALSLSLIGTAGMYFIFNNSIKKILYFTVIIISVIAFSFSLLYIFKPDTMRHLAQAYGNIISVFEGEQVHEASAGSRLKQAVTVGLFIFKNPSSIFFGNGNWSDQWKGNPQFTYGRFYASDVGILGSLLIYGILGILLVQFEFIFTFLWGRRVKKNRDNIFFQASRYFMFFYWLKSIPTGGSYFQPGMGIPFVFLTIVFFFYYIEKNPEKNYSIS